MAFAVHLNSYVLVILCALLWYGDRQLAAKHAEECQGDMLPIATDRRGNFSIKIFTVMYDLEGDHRLFLQSYAKILFFTERTKRSGVPVSFELVCLPNHK
jgi:hypothetical protein